MVVGIGGARRRRGRRHDLPRAARAHAGRARRVVAHRRVDRRGPCEGANGILAGRSRDASERPAGGGHDCSRDRRRRRLSGGTGYTDDAAGRTAAARAAARVGSSYDFLGTIGLPQDRTYYCSELALEAWRGREQLWSKASCIPSACTSSGRSSSTPGCSATTWPRRWPPSCARASRSSRRTRWASTTPPRLRRASGAVALRTSRASPAWLRSRSVKTVVSLRHYHGSREGEAVRAAGLRYEQIRLESTDAPEPEEMFAHFMAIVPARFRGRRRPRVRPLPARRRSDRDDDRDLPHGDRGLAAQRGAGGDGALRGRHTGCSTTSVARSGRTPRPVAGGASNRSRCRPPLGAGQAPNGERPRWQRLGAGGRVARMPLQRPKLSLAERVCCPEVPFTAAWGSRRATSCAT